MIKVLYSPQINIKDSLKYKFEGDKVTATLNGMTDIFDFTGMPDGAVDSVETVLPMDVIIEAQKKDGFLWLTLLKFIPENAPQSDRFPTWQVI